MASLLGVGKRGSGPSTLLQVKFSLGFSSQREFASANFYMFENLFARWD